MKNKNVTHLLNYFLVFALLLLFMLLGLLYFYFMAAFKLSGFIAQFRIVFSAPAHKKTEQLLKPVKCCINLVSLVWGSNAKWRPRHCKRNSFQCSVEVFLCLSDSNDDAYGKGYE